MTRPGRDTDRPRATALARWCEASEALKPLRGPLADARWQLLTGAVAPEDATQALARGLADASLSERWDAGGFAAFDASRQGHCVDRFVMASDQLRTSLATALPAALLERRPFEPGALFGKVGALEREIGRTRGGLSVRRLVEQYGDVIGAITPCVLVSPDSMARFLPPGLMSFDLVVFDEASQITVADAIGALGRAQAAVIAGDSKQMPPSSFADIGAEDREDLESEFLVVPDEESILTEAVHAGVNRIWLSWHYRSQDESLIAFSNAAYYEDRLSSFPAYAGQVHDTGISFTRLQGAFQRSGDPGLLRTNPVEAAAIVAEVLRRWAARERSIGVVTFNIQQRSLIETMLWESGVEGVAESLAARKDGLFVKNLENVQGDERDVILFSTGFSAIKDGVLPLNFGPLNRSGGERRLNVAVTRARRRVMVFSSFEPEDLRVEETSSIGIRDLRRYLEVAKYGVERTLGNRVRVNGSGTAARVWPWPCSSTLPPGRPGARRATGTRCRPRCSSGSWAGRVSPGSGSRPGSRTRTPSWRTSCSRPTPRPPARKASASEWPPRRGPRGAQRPKMPGPKMPGAGMLSPKMPGAGMRSLRTHQPRMLGFSTRGLGTRQLRHHPAYRVSRQFKPIPSGSARHQRRCRKTTYRSSPTCSVGARRSTPWSPAGAWTGSRTSCARSSRWRVR